MRQFGIKTAGLAVTWSLLGIAAGQSYAGCSDGVAPAKGHAAAHFTPALYNPGSSSGLFTPVAEEWLENSAIVGLWEFEFHLNGAQNGLADNALFDWGLATWHEDGTEIQFSAGRPPSSGEVCMGVWRQVGKHQFKLHHVALGLTPPSATGTYVGPAIIRATVTLDPAGDSYSGPYSVSLYPGSPDNGTEFNESGPALVTFSGTISAKRVMAP